MIAPFVAAIVALFAAQQAHPLRKSDLVRLLSGSTFSQEEIAGMVRRTCLSFAPSDRDRADFTALGASAAVLREIDACVRKAQPRPVRTRPAPVTPPARTVAPAPAASPPVVAPPVIPADAVHSGWTATRERGRPLRHLAAPLVFTARDAAGNAIAGASVTFTATNATLDAASITTDAKGHAAIGVTFGAKPLPATIVATVGSVALTATVPPDTGVPARLAVSCGGQALAGLLVLASGPPAALIVRAADAFEDPVPLDTLAVVSADERVMRVGRVSLVAGAATVPLDPRGGGTTVLTIAGAGLTRTLTAAVLSQPVPGVVPCATPLDSRNDRPRP